VKDSAEHESRQVPDDCKCLNCKHAKPCPTQGALLVLSDTCTNVASGLTNVAGIIASTCQFINDTRTETLPQGIFHAEHVCNLKCSETNLISKSALQ